MSSLEKETEKLMAFLKTQPLKSEGAEQEGQAGRKEGSELFYIGETVKGAESEKAPAQASGEVESQLSCISPDCSYGDWFRVGCALKHEGYAYEVFRDWSARAPNRFEEDACERTWDSIGEDHEGKVSLGTLRWMAKKSFLPEPKTADEMAEQALDFISTLFRPGVHFELVLKRGSKDGRNYPYRCRENIRLFDPERKTEFLTQLKHTIGLLSPGHGTMPPGA